MKNWFIEIKNNQGITRYHIGKSQDQIGAFMMALKKYDWFNQQPNIDKIIEEV